MTNQQARERGVIELLDAWPWERGGVTIGGYAVMAYGPPRYSHDLDVVIPAESKSFFHDWLGENRLPRIMSPGPNPQNFADRVPRYEAGDVKLDLLIGSVRDRNAQVDIPHSWISRNARMLKLTTVTASTTALVRIARPEVLWALKLQAGRDRDLSDLYAITPEPMDEGEIVKLFRGFESGTLAAKLRLVESKLDSSKLYADSLTRRALGSPDQRASRKQWQTFVARARRIIDRSIV